MRKGFDGLALLAAVQNSLIVETANKVADRGSSLRRPADGGPLQCSFFLGRERMRLLASAWLRSRLACLR
jgi:hypothetical protein